MAKLAKAAALGFLVSGLVCGSAIAQCTVAVMAGGGDLEELNPLHATLTEFGCAWTDVSSLAQAQGSGAATLIDRYGANNLSITDAGTWLASGRGYVQLGDWPNYIDSSYEYIGYGTPVTLTVIDTASPLTAGLPASWVGQGFWHYNSDGYVGWATDGGDPDLIEGQATGYSLHQKVVSSRTVGPGRAVYIGFNVYGPDAGTADKRVLANALSWTGQFDIGVTPVPALGALGGAAMILALIGLGAFLAARGRAA